MEEERNLYFNKGDGGDWVFQLILTFLGFAIFPLV